MSDDGPAEGEGFEPPGRCRPTVFKTAAIDHSANLPLIWLIRWVAKIVRFSVFTKNNYRNYDSLEKNYQWNRIRYSATTVTKQTAKLNTGSKKISPPTSGIHSGHRHSGKYSMSTTFPCMKGA